MTRCTSVDINFAHAFSLQEVEGVIAAGIYRIDTEEEPIDGLRRGGIQAGTDRPHAQPSSRAST